jgi:hypothetical protein
VKSFDEKFSVGRGVKCAGNQDECGLRGRRHLVKPGSSRTHFVLFLAGLRFDTHAVCSPRLRISYQAFEAE